MKKILFTTETGSDMPEEVQKKYAVSVVPMHVLFGDQSYPDGSIPVDSVFDYYEKNGKIPTTSCVNAQEYIDFFDRLTKENPDSVIYHFAYSSNASGTWQNARMALDERAYPNIFLIDTRTCTGGCTAQIVEAHHLILQKMKEAGLSVSSADEAAEETAAPAAAAPLSLPDDFAFASLAEEIQNLADHIECQFIPNTLEYLKAGGRVSNSKYLLANVLNLKPLIEINREGFLVTTKKYRGSMKRVVEKFLPDFFNRFDLKKDCIYLMYGKGLPQEVIDRMKEIAREYGFKSFIYIMTGCVISCHGGKGAIGLAGVTR